VLSASELDIAETDALALEARLARQQAAAREARVALGRHQLTAPFDGVVQLLLVSEGDWVEPGTTVIELVSSDRVDLRVDAPRELIQHVAIGDPVALSHRGRAAAARVVGVVPSLDPASRTAVVRVEPEPPSPDWLVAGLSVAARFDVRHDAADAARIPRDALVLGAVGTRVIKVVDGVAEAIDVEVLATAGDQALVRPLSPGDVVVVRGNERLRTGQKLAIEQPRAAVEDPR
jgi:RND family efflux transporter MFP subunit